MEPYPPRPRSPNYVRWFVVIALAVCVGNLAASYIQIYVAYEGVSLYLKGFNHNMEKAFASERREEAAAAIQRRQARERSPKGRQLAANCQQWQQELKQLNMPTVRQGVQEHCNAYEQYLERGY